MAKEQLKEFLREKKEKATPTGMDWAAKRDAWIKAVNDLYGAIADDYLGLADMTDIVQVDRDRMKTVEEPHIGSYSIPEMMLTVGDEQVLFSPKGVNVFGAAGRVDVQGDRGEATLVRQSDDRWSLVVSRSPTLKLVPLNDESFLEMLRSVMR